MAKRKFIVVNYEGKEVECYTINKASKIVGIPITEMKLAMYKTGRLPFYKLMGRCKKKRITRITGNDLRAFEQEYRKSKDLFDGIADKIVQARKEHPSIRYGLSQAALGKECGLSLETICKIERKKMRVGIKSLEKIAKAFGRRFEWFVSD